MADLKLEAQTRQTQGLLKTKGDWARFTGILSEAQARLTAEDQAFATGFDHRVRQATEIIVREARGLRPDQPWPDRARPSSETDPVAAPVRREAEARVYTDHRDRRAAIKVDALDALQDLRADLHARDGRRASPQTSTPRTRSGPCRF